MSDEKLPTFAWVCGRCSLSQAAFIYPHCNACGYEGGRAPVAGPADAPPEQHDPTCELHYSDDEDTRCTCGPLELSIPRPADAVRPPDDEPSVLGAGGGLPPMPTLEDVRAHLDWRIDLCGDRSVQDAWEEYEREVARASVEAQEDRQMLVDAFKAIHNCDGRCGRVHQKLSAYLKHGTTRSGLHHDSEK